MSYRICFFLFFGLSSATAVCGPCFTRNRSRQVDTYALQSAKAAVSRISYLDAAELQGAEYVPITPAMTSKLRGASPTLFKSNPFCSRRHAGSTAVLIRTQYSYSVVYAAVLWSGYDSIEILKPKKNRVLQGCCGKS